MVEITINNNIIELSNNTSITLSSTLMTIGKIDSLSGEYSFSFDIPTTPRNNKVMEFKNDLDTLNKFNVNYNVLINIDDTQIFQGSLLINSIDKENYKCNVYINKTNTLSDIFGDYKLTDIKWEIDYKQDITINEENAKENPEVIYPLISYGQFQKEQKDGKYTSIFSIDETTKLYNENFLPCPNLLTLVKKCFETKGYSVDGNIFDDEIIKKIYLSSNISDKQDFIYPYGCIEDTCTKSMGFCKVNGSFQNYNIISDTRRHAKHLTDTIETPQFTLIDPNGNKNNWETYNSYNIFSILTDENNLGFGEISDVKPDGIENTSMWRQNRIVAPVDGFYKIELDILDGSEYVNSTEQHKFQLWNRPDRNSPIELTEYSYANDSKQMYMELHLLKNTDVAEFKSISPYTYISNFTDWKDGSNFMDYNQFPVYPHEPEDKRIVSTEKNPYPGSYCAQNGKCLAYDSSVNPNFIMGISKMNAYNFTSVIKNGRSWDATCSDVAYVRTNVAPYYGIKMSTNSGSGTVGFERTPELTTDYQKNTLPNGSDNIISTNFTDFKTRVTAIVYLKKNDWIQLHMITRKFDFPVREEGESALNEEIDDAWINLNFSIKVSAFYPDLNVDINNDKIFDWTADSKFPKKLQVNTFLNSETKISDFIDNFIKTFNLSYIQRNNSITLNTQKVLNNKTSTIDLNNRIINYDFEKIDFPYSIQLKFNINEDEYGYINSVTNDKIDSPDWKLYTDDGSEKIILNGMEGEDEVTSNFSYCWYKDFNVITDTINNKITIPIIAKDEWMIDGYNVAENMKEDGYSLPQRMFFKGTQDNNITYGLYDINGTLQIKHLPLYNTYDNFELSFKKQTTKNKTILTKYFDTDYSTNIHYLNLTCYITANEYRLLKNGTNVIFNDNEYKVVEIEYSSDGECSLKLVSV